MRLPPSHHLSRVGAPDRVCAEGVAQVTKLRPSERFLVALAERLLDEVAPERIAEDEVRVANEALALADAGERLGYLLHHRYGSVAAALRRPLRPAV
jgi:hypothetical protein